jgi:hypothetical protein
MAETSSETKLSGFHDADLIMANNMFVALAGAIFNLSNDFTIIIPSSILYSYSSQLA